MILDNTSTQHNQFPKHAVKENHLDNLAHKEPCRIPKRRNLKGNNNAFVLPYSNRMCTKSKFRGSLKYNLGIAEPVQCIALVWFC